MVLTQFLVEVLRREVGIFLTIQPTRPLQFALRRPAMRDTAKTFVAKTIDAFGLVTNTLAAKMTASQADNSPASSAVMRPFL